MLSPKCPSCGSERIELKTINHIINGGNNSALIDINVEICQLCGEILFTPEQVRQFEEIKNKLVKGQTDSFIQIGKNFRVAY